MSGNLLTQLAVAASPELTQSTTTGLYLYNFNLIDGSGKAAVPHSALLIQDERIVQVWPGAVTSEAEPAVLSREGIKHLDLEGCTIMPGLVDMHVHLRHDEWALPLYLANGVTTVRDCANNLMVLQNLEQAQKSGRLKGPRLFYSGPLFDGAELSWPAFMCKRVESPEQVASRMVGLEKHPVDFIKLYTGLGERESAHLLAYSHDLNYYTAAHLGQGNAAALINQGLGGVEHIFSFSRQLAPERFGSLSQRDDTGLFFLEVSRVWDELGKGSLPETELLRLFDLMLERGTYLTPTLAFNYVCAYQNKPQVQQDPQLKLVDSKLKEFWARRSLTDSWQVEDFEMARRSVQVMARYAVRFWEMGGQLLIGSDTPNAYLIPGRSLHYELEALAEAGLPPLEIIRLATQGAAHQLARSERAGRTKNFGSIASGQLADLLILWDDPSRDIRNCQHIRYVMQGGQLYDPHQLVYSHTRQADSGKEARNAV